MSAASVFTLVLTFGAATASGIGPDEPPPFPRAFRGVWVATVGNIDWPSRPGLPVDQQKREALDILDRARAVGLNAVVFQVRPAADALYDSKLEPWSAYLTGAQGRAPAPYYDPLAFWVDQAHRRGLQLHAWFNPFRARPAGVRAQAAPNHVSRAHPEFTRAYGEMLWMDPGDPAARAQTLAVFLDVVRRYDVDGVHVDDYFYPYPVDRPGTRAPLDFPDEPSWQVYRDGGGKLDRADWRRQNINALMETVYREVKALRPHVLVGISPFGIPRPGKPPGVVGFDQYDKLYADAVRWLNQGWCDYFSPQLYWKIEAPGQPFRPLLNEWIRENARRRHIWPGLNVSRVGDRPSSYAPEEILGQIAILEETAGASGHVLFSMKTLMRDRRSIVEKLQAGPYREPALVPASPWLGREAPARPRVSAARRAGRLELTVEPGPGAKPALWAVSVRQGASWTRSVHPAGTTALRLDTQGERVAVAAVDRVGQASAPAVVDVRP